MQILELLQILLPILIQENIPFKLIRDSRLANWALDGNLGSEYLAKIIIVYPPSEKIAINLVKQITSITTDKFAGPSRTHRRWLGGIVYAGWSSEHKTSPNVWPFSEIASVNPAKKTKLLNYKYFPITIIKNDAKGDVSKALYFKYFWKIKSCIIKQGRLNMFSDENGRTIKDRLLWQAELYTYLQKDLPMPKIIDCFEQDSDQYLVMEQINGISLSHFFTLIRQDLPWFKIKQELQLKLIEYLLKVVDIVSRIHAKGFVHRDITSENFLVDNKGALWLIDLELMWSQKYHKPNPPFRLGTPGYISPEQSQSETPTVAEDIYALGAFMVQLFTNLHPTKLLDTSQEALRENLDFLIHHTVISELITRCIESDASKRPPIKYILNTLIEYKNEIQCATTHVDKISRVLNSTDNTKILATIQAALRGLGNPNLLKQNSTWVSNVSNTDNTFGNQQQERPSTMAGLEEYPVRFGLSPSRKHRATM